MCSALHRSWLMIVLLLALGSAVTHAQLLGADSPAFVVEIIAGSEDVGDGGPAGQARLWQAEGIASAPDGSLYIADAAGHRVRRVGSDGIIETVAGTGRAGFSGDGGPAAQAALNTPYDVALDAAGNLYIADLGNARVRRVDPEGGISTVAGGGENPAGGLNDGAAATMVELEAPRNLAVDSEGNVYISDFSGHRVFRRSPAGALWIVAGTGTQGDSGDGGPARAAKLSYPAGLALNAGGDLYIGDSQNHVIRKVSAGGTIQTIAEARLATGMTLGHDGLLYVADAGTGQVLKIGRGLNGDETIQGALPLAARDVAFGVDGTLYFSNGSLVRRKTEISLTVLAGGGDPGAGDFGPATEARLNVPTGVAVGADGTLYIADRENHRVRMVSSDGMITTVAGTGIEGSGGDGGPAARASLSHPESVFLDDAGRLNIADTGNGALRRVELDGTMRAVPLGTADGFRPSDATPDGVGNFYVAGEASIVRSDGNGVAATVLSKLAGPGGMAVDSEGRLFFPETGGGRVLRWVPGGDVVEIGAPGEDGVSVWGAPRAVALGPDGALYVADAGRAQILRVAFFEDGSTGVPEPLRLDAPLSLPWDLAFGPLGELYVADAGTNQIVRITEAAVAAPVVDLQVLHAATGKAGPVAPGMLVRIVGISPQSETGDAAAEITVEVGGKPVDVLGADDTSVVVQIPVAVVGADTVDLVVLASGNEIAGTTLEVAAEAPGLFVDADGFAIALNQDGTLNTGGNAAARGSVVMLYGTGQGIANAPVHVRIGYVDAEVLYSGPVQGNPGLWQINARVPSGYVPPGSLEVAVSVGGTSSSQNVRLHVK